MTNFAETNHFVEWMADSPATTQHPIDPTIPDDTVQAIKPIKQTVTQDALGYTGPDFKPRIVSHGKPDKPPHDYSKPLILDPSGEDYVNSEESKKRRSMRDELIGNLTKQILDEHADNNKRYTRAVAFMDRAATAEYDALPKEAKSKLKRAQMIVQRGEPMSEERAHEQAVKRASATVIRSVER